MGKGKSIALTLFVMLLWGSLFPMVKLGFAAFQVESVGDILLFAGIRFTLCGGVIWAFALCKKQTPFDKVKNSLVPIFLSGAFAIILHYAFTYIGLTTTASSKTAIEKQIGVLFYVLFSALFFKEDRLNIFKFIGVSLGFFGIVAINISGGGLHFQVGDALIILASFCTVFSNVISKKVFKKVDPITATGYSQLFGGVVLLLIGLLAGGKVQMAWDKSLWIFAYICFASIVSYCVWYMVLKQSNLSNLFIIKFAEPMFSCLLGALILSENIFKWQYLISFLLIAAGIVISNCKGKNKAEREAEREGKNKDGSPKIEK